MQARLTFVCFYRVALRPSLLQHPSGVEQSDAPAGREVLHVLPNIPCKNHNAATSGVQPDKRMAARSNTLQQIEPSGGSRLRGCTGSLHKLPPLGFPPGLSSLPPWHSAPMDFSSPANVSVFTSDRAKGSF